MSKIIRFFKEHDDIEIVAVFLPTALTAVIIVYTFISGIVGLF